MSVWRTGLSIWLAVGLALCSWACGSGTPPPRSLGRIMYIGDSITHGVGSASYRWPLHKILVDNGVSFEVIGVAEGNRYAESGVAPGTAYRGAPFNNRHCSVTSERAYEISGRKHPSPRLGGSDVWDWLGLDTSYNGPYKLPAGSAPDTCFILIGTNDIMGDYDGTFDQTENMQALTRALLDDREGDMSVIVAALRRANPQVRVIVLSIPTWEYHEKNNTASAYAAVQAYNGALAAWAQRQGVEYVDVFHVLADAACEEMPGKGVADFFYVEEGLHLHPSSQGDMLMAGEIARALGLPGRTAGLPQPPARTNAARFSVEAGCVYSLPLPCDRLDFSLRAAPAPSLPGESRRQGLHLSFGDGRHAGALTISSSYILWGDGRALYSADMAANAPLLRIAWAEGEPSAGIPAGFYVWLDGQLIGEALPALPNTPPPGLHLSNSSSGAISVQF